MTPRQIIYDYDYVKLFNFQVTVDVIWWCMDITKH